MNSNAKEGLALASLVLWAWVVLLMREITLVKEGMVVVVLDVLVLSLVLAAFVTKLFIDEVRKN